MNTLEDIVLLGTAVHIDAGTAWLLAAVAVLLSTLAAGCLPSLRASRGARVALVFVAIGAITQVVAGELLLFLTGSAVLGYAMLALALAGPRALTRLHALAAAILLIAGDLALLELVMLLEKYAENLTYAGAGEAFGKVSGDLLARFCLVIGFGSRVALVALCIPEGRSSAANVATLPGWVLLGVCATAGAIRLACQGSLSLHCAESLIDVLWWVPVLAVVAWQLPRTVPRLLKAVNGVGGLCSRIRSGMLQRIAALRPLSERAPGIMLRMESTGSAWAVAMGTMLVLALLFALVLGMAR